MGWGRIASVDVLPFWTFSYGREVLGPFLGGWDGFGGFFCSRVWARTGSGTIKMHPQVLSLLPGAQALGEKFGGFLNLTAVGGVSSLVKYRVIVGLVYCLRPLIRLKTGFSSEWGNWNSYVRFRLPDGDYV